METVRWIENINKQDGKSVQEKIIKWKPQGRRRKEREGSMIRDAEYKAWGDLNKP